MESYKVRFNDLEWQVSSAGARSKVFCEGSKQVRLVEFTSEFVEPEWCMKAHIGMILKGELELDFQGRKISYPEGSGLIIPAGPENAHKARIITPLFRCFW